MKPANPLESILERHRALLSGSLLAEDRRAELPNDRDAVHELQRAQRKRVEERLGEARAARQRAVERLDREVERLEEQLRQLDRAAEPGDGTIGGRQKEPKRPPAGRATPPLDEISGVGPKLSKRLTDAGYADAAALAAADPEELAASIDLPPGRTAKIIGLAKKLVGG